MNNIVNIEIEKIYPHPDNPRKDVGDLTELSDSIRKAGVLQNLTVIPKADGKADTYTVIIGHRRLAASKLAGLKTVPCVITEMSENEQIATMLLENIQRSDLTVYEQAEGFQLMMDLGETADTVSEKTGFSKSTVKRRLALLDLDREKLENASSRGGTISDYAELEKIKSPELKNMVLESIGTNKFDWILKDTLQKEKNIEIIKRIKEKLIGFATEVNEKPKNTSYDRLYSASSGSDIVIPENKDKLKYYFIEKSYGIEIYKEIS